MYLLDTNIVSLFDPRRAAEAGPIVQWMREHDSLLFLSTITLTEIEAGILKLSREKENARAGQLTALRDGLIADFKDRLLPLDAEVALMLAASSCRGGQADGDRTLRSDHRSDRESAWIDGADAQRAALSADGRRCDRSCQFFTEKPVISSSAPSPAAPARMSRTRSPAPRCSRRASNRRAFAPPARHEPARCLRAFAGGKIVAEHDALDAARMLRRFRAQAARRRASARFRPRRPDANASARRAPAENRSRSRPRERPPPYPAPLAGQGKERSRNVSRKCPPSGCGLRSRSRMISAAVSMLERNGFRLNHCRALDLRWSMIFSQKPVSTLRSSPRAGFLDHAC